MKRHSLTLLFLITFSAISCSKKSDESPKMVDVYTINRTSISMNYDASYQFVISKNGVPIDPNTVTFSNSNKTTGSLDNSGLFTAKRIGETLVKAEVNGNSLTSEVTVVPYSNLCKEPYISYGSSIAEVKLKETRTLSGETTSALLYSGENLKLRNVMYLFEVGKLSSAMLMFQNSTIVIEESVKFMAERYTYLGSSGGWYFFEDETSTVGIGYDATLGFFALYTKKTNTSNINSIKLQVNKIIESFDLQIKNTTYESLK